MVAFYTDGKSFIKDVFRYVGAAITTDEKGIWSEALPPGTSTNRAGMIALKKALQLKRKKRLNTYTDSWYLFAMIHIHRAIYGQGGLLTAEEKTVKNKQGILDFLQSTWLPLGIIVIHFSRQQKREL